MIIPSLTNAQNNFKEKVITSSLCNLEKEPVITDELKKHMDIASDNELIPVTIELNYYINTEEVDTMALEHENISEQELMKMETAALLLN